MCLVHPLATIEGNEKTVSEEARLLVSGMFGFELLAGWTLAFVFEFVLGANVFFP